MANDELSVASVPVRIPTLDELYLTEFTSLARLAAGLLGDRELAQDVVQEAYVRIASKPHRLRDPDRALAYLRQTVVNLCRSSLKRRAIGQRATELLLRRPQSARPGIEDLAQNRTLFDALGKLPRRRREVLVLRFYADLSVVQTAELMGISEGAVKSSCSRALQDLKRLLEES